MDKSFPEFLLVPYRPVSGKLAKDLRNTFIFTMDTLQVTETAYKEHHPEIFSNPFITIRFVDTIFMTVSQWDFISHKSGILQMFSTMFL